MNRANRVESAIITELPEASRKARLPVFLSVIAIRPSQDEALRLHHRTREVAFHAENLATPCPAMAETTLAAVFWNRQWLLIC
jgi:hypothetical protein